MPAVVAVVVFMSVTMAAAIAFVIMLNRFMVVRFRAGSMRIMGRPVVRRVSFYIRGVVHIRRIAAVVANHYTWGVIKVVTSVCNGQGAGAHPAVVAHVNILGSVNIVIRSNVGQVIVTRFNRGGSPCRRRANVYTYKYLCLCPYAGNQR